MYRTPQESLAAFRWFNEVGNWEEHFSAWERFVVVYVGAAVVSIYLKIQFDDVKVFWKLTMKTYAFNDIILDVDNW